MLWSDAEMCILLDRLELFARKKDDQVKYDEYRNALERNGIGVKDVILRKMKNHSIAWMKNDFPYDVRGATHYLLWSLEPLPDEKIREIAARHAHGRDFVTFVNPDHLKTVPDLWHAHVFIRDTY